MRVPWCLLSMTTGKTVVARLAIADRFWPRFVGWQFRSRPTAGAGLLIVPCNSVHTCFVRFSLDVLFLDRTGTVLAVRRNLRPWRLALGPRNSHAVVEILPGSADVQSGEILRLEGGQANATAPKAAAFLLD